MVQKLWDEVITKSEVRTSGERTSVVGEDLRNGLVFAAGSRFVRQENYHAELGAEICLEKIRDKVWFLLGFLLQTAVYGI